MLAKVIQKSEGGVLIEVVAENATEAIILSTMAVDHESSVPVDAQLVSGEEGFGADRHRVSTVHLTFQRFPVHEILQGGKPRTGP